MTQAITRKSLYETDFLLWTEETIAKLKARDFDHVDLENLIEEIESLGKSDKKVSVDEGQFNVLMLESKKIARASWKGSGSDQTSKIWFELKEKYGPTEFLVGSEIEFAKDSGDNREVKSFSRKK